MSALQRQGGPSAEVLLKYEGKEDERGGSERRGRREGAEVRKERRGRRGRERDGDSR